MTDTSPTPTPSEDTEAYYTETVVEYVDNRRQRAILGAVLVILFLLLIGVVYTVLRLAPGKGAPTSQAAMPKGITWVRSIYGWGNNLDQQLATPTDVAIAGDGSIWAVSGHRTIAGFNPDGSVKRIIQPKGTVSIEGIAVAENGNLYVSDFGGQVLEFTQAGDLVESWKVELPIEVDVRDGKIAVAAAQGIAIFTKDGGEMLAKVGGARGWGPDQFDLPHGIALAPDGTVYVSDTQNRRIKALSSTGRVLWTFGVAPNRSATGVADVRSPDSTTTTQPFLLPSGMTLDGNGRIVLVDPFRFNIVVVDPKTKKIAREPGTGGKQGRQAIYGEYGAADGLFAYPTGIAYDSNRDWFAVADTNNNRIQILRLPGSGGSPLAPVIGGFSLPMCLFCLPLLLLLAAIVLTVMRRRREKAATDDAQGPDADAVDSPAESSDPESSSEG